MNNRDRDGAGQCAVKVLRKVQEPSRVKTGIPVCLWTRVVRRVMRWKVYEKSLSSPAFLMQPAMPFM